MAGARQLFHVPLINTMIQPHLDSTFDLLIMSVDTGGRGTDLYCRSVQSRKEFCGICVFHICLKVSG